MTTRWVARGVAIAGSTLVVLPIALNFPALLPELALDRWLEWRTPLGADSETIAQTVRNSGRRFDLHSVPVPEGSSHPPSEHGGSAFAVSRLGDFGLLFPSTVEVFYIFRSGKLVEIRSRVTTDAP